jgi:hypothetical protein
MLGQEYSNKKLKKLSNFDSIYVDSFKFYKISNFNINHFLEDTNSLIIEYSTWCRGFKDRNSLVDSILKINPKSKIYLLTSDLNTSIKVNIEYLKNNNLNYKVVFLDYNIYNKGNWGIKWVNFIRSIIPDVSSDFFKKVNATRFIIKKDSNNNIIFKGLQ